MTLVPGTIELPETSPREGDFYICRWNDEWTEIILGAVHDALYHRTVWVDDGVQLSEVPKEVDDLLLMLMTEVEVAELQRTAYLHSWMFRARVGGVQHTTNSLAFSGTYVWNNTNSNNDEFHAPIAIPAGSYTLMFLYWRGSTGGLVTPQLVDNEGDAIDFDTVDTYNASAIWNNVYTDSVVIAEDITQGRLRFKCNSSPVGGSGANAFVLQEAILRGIFG